MKQVDLSRLPEFLQSRRWFGGKAWPIKSISVLDHAELEAPDGRTFTLGVVEVVYTLGNPEIYVLPVRPGKDGGIVDALEDDALSQGLFRLLREGLEVKTSGGVLRGERVVSGEGDLSSLPATPPVRRLGVEQTNTSVVFGDRVIFKLIRRIEKGESPEVEVGAHLAKVGYASTPPLLGHLHLTGILDSTLAVVHRFVKTQGDGWGHFLAAFRGQPQPSAALLDEVHRLGKRTAQLHLALADDRGDPAFAPEPLQREDLSRWSSSIIGELGVSLAQAASRFPELERKRDALVARAQRLAHVEPSGMKTRVHGDLHLGQVLRVEKDWLLFDFEGEPARAYVARREKHSPLRDVAGMLRSFGYADAAASTEAGPAPGRLGRVRKAFLDGYQEAARGAAFLPAPEAFRQILDALELEKVLYELRYELQHRPDWVGIPARTLLELEDESP